MEKFVRSNSDFITFEKNKIAERKTQFEKEKDEILSSLNQNLDKLNVLFRENFSIDEFSIPIKDNIKKIQSVLNDESISFEIEIAQRILLESTKTIEAISKNVSTSETLNEYLKLGSQELDKILRTAFGTERGNQAASLLERIKDAKTVFEKEELSKEIKKFLGSENGTDLASEVKPEDVAKSTTDKNTVDQGAVSNPVTEKVEVGGKSHRSHKTFCLDPNTPARCIETRNGYVRVLTLNEFKDFFDKKVFKTGPSIAGSSTEFMLDFEKTNTYPYIQMEQKITEI